jgi:polyferredoxin
MFDSVLKLGWRVVEAALLLVIVCMIFHIILGTSGGSFIGAVAANASSFIRDVPPGTFLGVVLIVGMVGYLKARSK